MNRKKYYFVLALIVAAFSVFTACGDDDEITPAPHNQLLGKWYALNEENGVVSEFVFYEDGTMVDSIYASGVYASDVSEGIYTINKDTLTLEYLKRKERVAGRWSEFNSTKTISLLFRVDGENLNFYSLTSDETLLLTRKKRLPQNEEERNQR